MERLQAPNHLQSFGGAYHHIEIQDGVSSEVDFIGHRSVVIVEVHAPGAKHLGKGAELLCGEALMRLLFFCPVFVLYAEIQRCAQSEREERLPPLPSQL